MSKLFSVLIAALIACLGFAGPVLACNGGAESSPFLTYTPNIGVTVIMREAMLCDSSLPANGKYLVGNDYFKVTRRTVIIPKDTPPEIEARIVRTILSKKRADFPGFYPFVFLLPVKGETASPSPEREEFNRFTDGLTAHELVE